MLVRIESSKRDTIVAVACFSELTSAVGEVCGKETVSFVGKYARDCQMIACRRAKHKANRPRTSVCKRRL